ncbi:hypothetical protein LOTGIDRAFT_166655 [Lottia gigantea]|uniref:VWFA domain-containing protein n=1 Tax=Lottia gigantea TaxID=225164 RepID=V3ZRG9_LOTGI|nr:hypothetical protein LOTGIDRAFT_166655 [Lottia gigantea]ESO86927.1 hypothetical protein LOTGIDRAFT_166655 [Lottia gigantea]
MDIYLVVDGSGSVKAARFELMKQTLADILPDLNVSPSVVNLGLVVYSEKVYDVLPLTGDATKRTAEILALPFPGSYTSTDLGIAEATAMSTRSGRSGVPQKTIVITDGISGEPQQTVARATDAKNAGIDMYSVGVGGNANPQELDNIASSVDQVHLADTFDVLGDVLRDIVKGICNGVPAVDVSERLAF